MERLVYRPKAYAYIQTVNDGLVDISDDIVRGQVSRRVNQVSTAELTIRNDRFKYTPKDRPGDPVFRPMDGITVWLSRIPAFPVQVFTGYLDSTPYFQLYPGTVTLEASCTLKRLQYTFWDWGLPYVTQFMRQYNWFPNGAGQIVNWNSYLSMRPIDIADPTKLKQSTPTDGSIGELLFATLNKIGGWDPRTIWIEELPTDLWKSVSKLWKSLSPELTFDQQVLTEVLGKIVGAGGQGSGNPSPNASGGTGKVWQVLAGQESNDASNGGPGCDGTPSEAITGYSELSVDLNLGFDALGKLPCNTELIITNPQNGKATRAKKQDNGNGSAGFKAAMGLYPPTSNFLGFSDGGPYTVQIQRTDGGDLTIPSGYGTLISNGPGSSTVSAVGQKVQKGGPASSTVSSVATSAANVATAVTSNIPFFPLPKGEFLPESTWSQDQGVDISTPNGDCGQKAPLLALGAGTVVGHGIGGFGPDAPILKLDNPIQGQSYVYYGHAGPDGAVNIGSHVQAGQQIGSVGCGIVGISTGPHLEIGFSDANGSPVPGTSGLMLQTLKSAQQGTPVPGGATSGTSGGGGNTAASAFGTFFNFATAEDTLEAMLLNGDRSLMNDQPLLPFVQELATGSMRSFQSMPNGNFFGFFPDWFGTFNHRSPYWAIDDIEILDGKIELSDESLVTHMYVVGDTITPNQQIDIWEKLASHGVITIFNAGVSDWFNHQGQGGLSPVDLSTKSACLKFLSRYGARPMYDPEPTIRSTEYEAIVAWQKFMQAWSKQFLTTFTFTFMPEIYPGGLVSFPTHGLQMYVEEVLHSFDYEQGFTTQANLSSPAALKGTDTPFNRGLVLANG